MNWFDIFNQACFYLLIFVILRGAFLFRISAPRKNRNINLIYLAILISICIVIKPLYAAYYVRERFEYVP